MGSRMAANLLAAGYDVTAWNRNPAHAERLVEAGATTRESPREAARGADFVMSMVTDDNASSAVWTDPETGAIAGLSPDATVIEMSTVSPDWIASLSKRVTATGACFLDAPVAGTLPQAENRQLIFFVGGDEEVFEIAKPVLRSNGRHYPPYRTDRIWSPFQVGGQRIARGADSCNCRDSRASIKVRLGSFEGHGHPSDVTDREPRRFRYGEAHDSARFQAKIQDRLDGQGPPLRD
jgi:hypothetical protein